MFGRRGQPTATADQRRQQQEPSADDLLLAQTIARHAPGASAHGQFVGLMLGGTGVRCHVGRVQEIHGCTAATLDLRVMAGAFGNNAVPVSLAGYGRTAREAIVSGGIDWVRSFLPVLRAAITSAPHPDGGELEAELHGRRFRVVHGGYDAALVPGGADPGALVREHRERLTGGAWLVPRLVASGRLPLLPAPTLTALSVTARQGQDGHTSLVVVNGGTWPAGDAVPDAGGHGRDAVSLLRELAVLVPLGPPAPLTRAGLRTTLEGLATRSSPGRTAGWPGWAAHGGGLGEPLQRHEIAALGPLPADYARFLGDVAAEGAGPGYGLRAPRREHGDVIPLAHAGCGREWLLHVAGRRSGTVSLREEGKPDAEVAPSFTAWLEAWLDTVVRERPFLRWRADTCRAGAAPGPCQLHGVTT